MSPRNLSPTPGGRIRVVGDAVGVEVGTEAATQAWARLAGLADLAGVQVTVSPESPLGRRGWIGILGLDRTITACVPRAGLESPLAAALGGHTSQEAATPDIVRARLPPTRAVLRPAMLFSPPRGFGIAADPGIEEVSKDALSLLLAVSPDHPDESGLDEVAGAVFASRATNGELAAACGYRRWPNDVAHLSVHAHLSHRRRATLHARRQPPSARPSTRGSPALDAGVPLP